MALRRRHRQVLMVLALAALALLCFQHLQQGASSSSSSASAGGGDRIVALMSQIGYLKKLLASSGRDSPSSGSLRDDPTLPVIYVVTPTYERPVQMAELTRLCQTLLLVPNVHWVVVEDARARTKAVSALLRRCGVPYEHLWALTPADRKLDERDPHWRKPKGVVQRNEALGWIRDNARPDGNGNGGAVYFADDDNTYDVDLFEEIRSVGKVKVWPVGLVGGLKVEKPVVAGDAVVGWDVMWSARRPYAVDMAGFAVGLRHLLSRPRAKFAYEVKRGYQETEFLKELAALDELETNPGSWDRVMVWHTRTERVRLDLEEKRREQGKPPSDHGIQV